MAQLYFTGLVDNSHQNYLVPTISLYFTISISSYKKSSETEFLI